VRHCVKSLRSNTLHGVLIIKIGSLVQA